MPATNRIADMLPEISKWRQDIHAHPELEFQVHRTASLVAEKLRAFGVDEIVEGIGQTGVVGIINGRTNSSSRVVGLRADMDALPIIEATGLPYASTHAGRMHACGHDGHTAMLLGAARYLCETRNFDGQVAVIFQPAEEFGAGGREMVEDGLMDRFNIEEIYGMHNWPGIPVGHFALVPGPIMASADQFSIDVTGRGGHAAMPETCVDPIVASTHIIQALQTIVSRNIAGTDHAIISITTIRSEGDSFNVIPQTVHMKGTVRALDGDIQDQVEKRMHEVVENTSRALGVTSVLDYDRGYPVTVNASTQTDIAASVAAQVAGTAQVDREITPTMGSEDFSYMLKARPGAFIFIGNGDSAALHHPEYNFNDEVILNGCSYWIQLVEKTLQADV